MDTIFQMLNYRYMTHTLSIQNFKIASNMCLTLFFVLHIFACFWIYLGVMKDGWWDKNNQTNMQDEYSQMYE